MLQKQGKAGNFTGMCSWDDLNSLTLDLCVCISLPSEITIKMTSMCFKKSVK